VTGSATVTIQPRPVTLTADNKSKVFGASDPELTATMTSGTMVSGETLDYSVSRAPGEDVDTYAITVAPGTNSNYYVTTNPGTFTITSASPMTASAPNVRKTYDGTAYGIVVTPDTDGATISYGSSADAYDLAVSPTQTNVGALTVYYQVTKAGYTTVTGSATVTIDPRLVTLTADDKSKVQGVEDPALTATLTSGTVVSGETLNYSISREPGEDVDTYEITILESLNSNYIVTTVPGTFTITLSSTLTASASNIVQTYDGTPYGIAVSPNLAGATVSYGLSAGTYNLSESPTQTNVGMLTVYYQVTKQGYAAVSGSATVTINPRPVTLTANNGNKVRGNADPVLTAALTSGTVVSGETLSYLVSRTPGESVGTYQITIAPGDNGNYIVTTYPGTFTITEPYNPPQPPTENHAPVAVNDTGASVAGAPVAIAVLTNDSDPDGDPLSITGTSNPGHGTATVIGNQITYTPAAGFVGTDTFTYTITDGQGHTATATVTVDVSEIILPPEEEIPGGETVLPKTGGINPLVYCGAGLALAGVGLVLRKRK
jgi:LPXTG-motif cell wall-anchored protein